MLPAIEWENLTPAHRLALAAAGEGSPLAFVSCWFNITQGESFRANWHHHYYSWAVQQMTEGKARCIVINVPPGSTKTEFFSIHTPAYCAVKFPRVRILNGSYSKDLVVENSERTRALIKSDEFQEMYPCDIGKDKADNWTILRDGKSVFQMFSRSNGGQITGARGGYMIDGFSGYVAADDWDKPDDMFSDAKRNKSHTRLVNTLRSRRAMKADDNATPMLFIQQRLHVDDSSAFILSGGMGIKVDLHINIPALIDRDYIDTLPDVIRERCIRDVCGSEQTDGKWSYWPETEGIRNLLDLRDAHPYTFLSQYMQAPDTLEGGIFTEGGFQYYGDDEGADLPVPPKWEYRFITADTAQKTNTWNDWTVFAEWGVFEGRIYRLNYQRARMEAPQLRRDLETFIKASWSKNGGSEGSLRAVLVEDKVSGTGVIQEVKGKVPLTVTPVQREKDKLTRALDAQGHQMAGKVVLPYGDPQNFEFVSEVASFTPDDTHRFDDQTDVMIEAIDYAIIGPKLTSKPRIRAL
jgi:predicted phage terminase large subunit-like protein